MAKKKPVIMKLTPNVTSIAEMARAAEAGGADGISLINTLTAMKIDIYKRSFVLANKTGGLSGPAIHPIAVRMVYEAAHAVKIPVIGMGGIATYVDAIEMMMAGATMVGVGMMNFTEPDIVMHIIAGIEQYMNETGTGHVSELIGIL
jgi:dihydroorotate dehydrogenase (NAD+) catalytic subunit